MPGRGLLVVAVLLPIALLCIGVSRRLDRERRLIARFRTQAAFDAARGIDSRRLSDDERDTAAGLASAGVLRSSGERQFLDLAAAGAFRRRRQRVALLGALAALLAGALVATMLLGR